MWFPLSSVRAAHARGSSSFLPFCGLWSGPWHVSPRVAGRGWVSECLSGGAPVLIRGAGTWPEAKVAARPVSRGRAGGRWLGCLVFLLPRNQGRGVPSPVTTTAQHNKRTSCIPHAIEQRLYRQSLLATPRYVSFTFTGRHLGLASLLRLQLLSIRALTHNTAGATRETLIVQPQRLFGSFPLARSL